MKIRKIRFENNTRIYLLLGILFVMFLNYVIVIAPLFYYEGYSLDFFSIPKLFVSIIYIVTVVYASAILKKDFYKLIYSLMTVLYIFGQVIFYLYNDSSFLLLLAMGMPMLAILAADWMDNGLPMKRRILDLKDQDTRIFFILLAVIAVIPFLRYISTLNLKNLLLLDIYETRLAMRKFRHGILGYLFSPLSRTVFPFLFIYGWMNKKKLTVGISILGAISLYLLFGAVKSVFFGIFAALVFIYGDYNKKEKYFLFAFLLANIAALFSFVLFDSFMINDYMRRLALVPARLFEVYHTFFKGNFTYYNHTKLMPLITGVSGMRDIPLFIGEVVIGRRGQNANVGIFVEGYLSLGLIGVFLHSLVFMATLYFIRKLDFPPPYFGIVFTYLYILNTSFLEPLYITHGLLFFLVFAYLVFPRNSYYGTGPGKRILNKDGPNLFDAHANQLLY